MICNCFSMFIMENYLKFNWEEKKRKQSREPQSTSIHRYKTNTKCQLEWFQNHFDKHKWQNKHVQKYFSAKIKVLLCSCSFHSFFWLLSPLFWTDAMLLNVFHWNVRFIHQFRSLFINLLNAISGKNSHSAPTFIHEVSFCLVFSAFR